MTAAGVVAPQRVIGRSENFTAGARRDPLAWQLAPFNSPPPRSRPFGVRVSRGGGWGCPRRIMNGGNAYRDHAAPRAFTTALSAWQRRWRRRRRNFRARRRGRRRKVAPLRRRYPPPERPRYSAPPATRVCVRRARVIVARAVSPPARSRLRLDTPPPPPVFRVVCRARCSCDSLFDIRRSVIFFFRLRPVTGFYRASSREQPQSRARTRYRFAVPFRPRARIPLRVRPGRILTFKNSVRPETFRKPISNVEYGIRRRKSVIRFMTPSQVAPPWNHVGRQGTYLRIMFWPLLEI